MRRFFVLGLVLGAFCLLSTTAQAQYTSQRKHRSATSSSVTTKTSNAIVTQKSSAVVSSQTSAGESSQRNNEKVRSSDLIRETRENMASGKMEPAPKNPAPSGMWGQDVTDVPDFTVSIEKNAQSLTTEQKVTLLEEYAKKQEAEAKAKAAAEQAKKDALAKKLATEKPKPGFVFDEQGNELPIPKGEIWTYSTGYEQGDLYGRVYCSWKIVLQNRTDAVLTNFAVGMNWPSYSMEATFSDVAPNETKTQDMFMYSPDCPSLRSKPRMEVKNCVLGPMKAADCSSYFVAK